MPALPLPGARAEAASAEFRLKPVEPNRGRFCALRRKGFSGTLFRLAREQGLGSEVAV